MWADRDHPIDLRYLRRHALYSHLGETDDTASRYCYRILTLLVERFVWTRKLFSITTMKAKTCGDNMVVPMEGIMIHRVACACILISLRAVDKFMEEFSFRRLLLSSASGVSIDLSVAWRSRSEIYENVRQLLICRYTSTILIVTASARRCGDI